MKKFITWAISLLAIFLLAWCSASEKQQTDNVKHNQVERKAKKFYTVKVDEVIDSLEGQWIISGTTKDPDGTKIIVTSNESQENIAKDDNDG
jgi:hypothetical protein